MEFEDTKRSKRPVIIIHRRNTNDDNKIVIEIKKNKVCLWDYLKLEYMTSPKGAYNYKLGVFIYFLNGEPKYKWFINGLEKDI